MSPRAAGRQAAERAAAELLSRHRISRAPIDPYRLAKAEGIEVVHEAMSPDTSSMLLREPSGDRVICVNESHSVARQRFSVAHELGHAVLHFGSRSPAVSEAAVSRPLEVLFRDGLAESGTDAVEVDANSFAAALLMPASAVTVEFRTRLRSGPRRSTGAIIDQVASVFGVSSQAMSYRLINLGVVDPA